MANNTITVHVPAEAALLVNSSAFHSVQIVRVAPGQITQTVLPSRNIRLGPFSSPREYRISSDSDEFQYSLEEEKFAYNHLGTGIFSGGIASINALDDTKFDLTAGTGAIVDNYSDPEVPEVLHIQWPDFIGIEAEFLGTTLASYFGIDKTGALVQFDAFPTSIQRRQSIFIGGIGSSGSTIDSIDSAPVPGYDQAHMLIDMADTFGVLTKSGNIYGPNGANLKLDKTLGESFSIGRNWENSTTSPNIKDGPALTAPSMFIGIRDGAGGHQVAAISTDVPVGFYDNNTGTPVAVPPSDPWQIFRLYYVPASELTVLVYGQNLYKNKAVAEAAIFGEVYDESPALGQAALRAYLIVKSDATDLSDTGKAKFIQANALGTGPGAGVSTSTTTLQQSYANSAQPEIVTNTTQQALTLKEGTADATNTVLEVLNNGDTLVYSVDGQGRMSGAIEGGVTGSRPATPLDFQVYFDTTIGKPVWYDGTNWVDATGATV